MLPAQPVCSRRDPPTVERQIDATVNQCIYGKSHVQQCIGRTSVLGHVPNMTQGALRCRSGTPKFIVSGEGMNPRASSRRFSPAPPPSSGRRQLPARHIRRLTSLGLSYDSNGSGMAGPLLRGLVVRSGSRCPRSWRRPRRGHRYGSCVIQRLIARHLARLFVNLGVLWRRGGAVHLPRYRRVASTEKEAERACPGR